MTAAPAKEVSMTQAKSLSAMRQLSPLRNSTAATKVDELVGEQLRHFAIDPASPYGKAMAHLTASLYEANLAAHDLVDITLKSLGKLDRGDRIAWFNAKRFACFQLAKVLDNLQTPMRHTYQSLAGSRGIEAARGPYPIFDNVTAIFSSTPVITRTATYLYACVEWVEDAFKGKELLHEIYSRLLNPTSISLANHIVDVEAGPLAHQYFAWNFNSGMAAVDCTLAHLVGYQDVVLASRNVYGGVYQLLHDWYGKRSNLDIALRWFDGYTADDFAHALKSVQHECAQRLAKGRKIYVYLESPCNPHGHVLDVAGISRLAHAGGLTVICDSTVGTPFLQPVLRREAAAERPDFVIHSYTKDLGGYGATTAGVVIARNEIMFLPKGSSATMPGSDGKSRTVRWDETLFWNVYYIKGAFLDADKAYEVINGMRTLELRMLAKCITTAVFARALASHPRINVNCSAVPGHPNAALREANMFLGLPAPLFTIDFEPNRGEDPLPRDAFKAFFDILEPVFGLQVSLGQTNTVVLCPALTSHSEMSDEALAEAGISRTTVRIAVGNEDPRTLLAHLMRAMELAFDPVVPGFSKGFMAPADVDRLYEETYIDVHRRYVQSRPKLADLLR
jgi:cystathionine beta-lyase/cystathionine gamma-synthase